MSRGKHSAGAKHFDTSTDKKRNSKFLKITFKILILFIIAIFLFFIYDNYLKGWSLPTSNNNIEVNKKSIEKLGFETSLAVESAEYLEVIGVYVDTDGSGRSKISLNLKNNSNNFCENLNLRLNLLDEDNNEILFFDFEINKIDANSEATTYISTKQDLSNCINYSIILKEEIENI